MGSTSVSVQTPTILGTLVVAATAVATGETVTITATTAQSILDTSTLFVRVSAVGGSVTPTIDAGTKFSSYGQGAKALTAIASSTTRIIGGQDFEGSRFLITAGTIVMSFVGTGTASIEAYQAPSAIE
jgi:hypothetical protein